MTPEAQRIAIATACGWTIHHGGKYCAITNCTTRTLANRLFDPLIDLNAMHEALLTLNEDQQTAFTRELLRLTPYLILATAAQKAEAFLKTLNLWVDK